MLKRSVAREQQETEGAAPPQTLKKKINISPMTLHGKNELKIILIPPALQTFPSPCPGEYLLFVAGERANP